MEYNEEEMKERAIRFFTEPLPPRGGRFAKHFQQGHTGPPVTLASHEDALAWVRSHPIFPAKGSAVGLNGQLKTDFRLTPESLPWLLDLVSSADEKTVQSTLFALTVNRSEVAHDETDTSPVTTYTITLPDGSVHERLANHP